MACASRAPVSEQPSQLGGILCCRSNPEGSANPRTIPGQGQCERLHLLDCGDAHASTKVACQTIKFGRGVCGAAAASQQTQLVPNVEEFPGHIACDGESASEIVVPIVHKGKVSGEAVALE
jgi:hypothetical protein